MEREEDYDTKQQRLADDHQGQQAAEQWDRELQSPEPGTFEEFHNSVLNQINMFNAMGGGRNLPEDLAAEALANDIAGNLWMGFVQGKPQAMGVIRDMAEQLILYIQTELIPSVRSVEGGQPLLDKGWDLVGKGWEALKEAKELIPSTIINKEDNSVIPGIQAHIDHLKERLTLPPYQDAKTQKLIKDYIKTLEAELLDADLANLDLPF